MGNVKFDFEYQEKGKDVIMVFSVVADVTYYTDNNYGADADGNRGVSTTFIDDVDYESIKEILEDGSEISVDYDALPDSIQKEIDDRVNDADPETTKEPDYDPDIEYDEKMESLFN